MLKSVDGFNTSGSDSTAQNLNRHPALAQPA